MMALCTNQQDQPVLLDLQQDASDFRDQVPIRFRIYDQELLGGIDNPWLPLMLPGFATFGMACLRLIKPVGRATLELDDYAHALLFQMDGADLLICSTIVNTAVRVHYDILFATWGAFAALVRDTVIQRHPEKQTYGWWKLISEDPPAHVAEELTRLSWFEEHKECFSSKIA
jgi:hypothetical protein